MSGPRNRPAWEEAQRVRRAIRRAMLDHAELHPLEPITAKVVRRKLPWLPLTDGGIRGHMRAVRREARRPAPP